MRSLNSRARRTFADHGMRAFSRSTSSKPKVVFARPLESSLVKASSYNLHDFFEKTAGLWISQSFRDLFLNEVSQGVISVPNSKIGFVDLNEKANDHEIGQNLPKGHMFECVDSCFGVLATLIDAQMKGRDCPLIKSAYLANIIQFKAKDGRKVTIRTGWHAGNGDWYCRANDFSNDGLPGGYRVFSAVNS